MKTNEGQKSQLSKHHLLYKNNTQTVQHIVLIKTFLKNRTFKSTKCVRTQNCGFFFTEAGTHGVKMSNIKKKKKNRGSNHSNCSNPTCSTPEHRSYTFLCNITQVGIQLTSEIMLRKQASVNLTASKPLSTLQRI